MEAFTSFQFGMPLDATAEVESGWSHLHRPAYDVADDVAQRLNSDPLASSLPQKAPLYSHMEYDSIAVSDVSNLIAEEAFIGEKDEESLIPASFTPEEVSFYNSKPADETPAPLQNAVSPQSCRRCVGIDRISMLQQELARQLGLRIPRNRHQEAARNHSKDRSKRTCRTKQDANDVLQLAAASRPSTMTSSSPSEGTTEPKFISEEQILGMQPPEHQIYPGESVSGPAEIQQAAHTEEETRKTKAPVGKPKKVKIRGPKLSIHTKTELDIMDDGFKWRKYGQKAVKNSRYPRSYYRCTSKECKVKKYVERHSLDQSYVVTTYEGTHNHQSPSTLETSSNILPSMYSLSTPNLIFATNLSKIF